MTYRRRQLSCLLAVVLLFQLCLEPAIGFLPRGSSRPTRSAPQCPVFGAKHDNEAPSVPNPNEENPSSSYKFGDVSRFLARKATSAINQVTGKDSYEFGDLSRHFDKKAKDAINNITGKDEYELFDLTRWADSQAKAKLANYTGKETYQVGDISKEIIRRVSTGEYALEDILFLCKVLVALGAGLTPVASALPAKLLLEMLNASLVQDVSGRLTGILASTLDERFKEALTGNKNYLVSDFTKRAILQFTGKDEYNVGDLVRTVASKIETKDGSAGIGLAMAEKTRGAMTEDNEPTIDPQILTELEEWDRALQRGSKAMKEK